MPTSTDEPLRGRIAVVSPHLDDAVLSLGASMWRASRAGANITVVTVLAGDPASEMPAGDWDAVGGFATAGDAIRTRRDEDGIACRLLNVTPVWLPFADEQYPRGGDDGTVAREIADVTRDADVVLIPGFPLLHADHVFASRLVLATPQTARIGLYVEQPYAADHRATEPAVPDPVRALTGEAAWVRLAIGRDAMKAKRAAARAYRSQWRALRGRRTLRRIARYESACGGETIGWLSGRT